MAHSHSPEKLDFGPLISASHAPKIIEVGKKEVVFMPPDVDIYKNIKLAREHPFWDRTWFKKQVEKGGSWDYKKQSLLYENFGNFHDGIVGSAQGILVELLK